MVNLDHDLAVEIRQITKKFGNFTANDSIDFDLKKGEIHALLGENGAGKSTLMNILYGLYTPTEGEIFINGEKTNISNPNDAIAHGLGMVHQHFMLIEPFKVYENIILGVEPMQGMFINRKKAREKVEDLSKKYGLSINVDSYIRDISVGMQQRVEILKALYRGAEILIFDEPTAVLTPQEIDEFIEIVRNLAAQGKSIIIITHKLKEIKAMADRCTIIRRGKKIDTVDVPSVSPEELASKMVGRNVDFRIEKKPSQVGDVVLKVDQLNYTDKRKVKILNDFSLDLHYGEILGIAGVDGNGQSELLDILTGLRKTDSGKIYLKDKDITNKSPRQIQESGMNCIPEDRQKRGLVLEFTTAENLVLEQYRHAPYCKKGILQEEVIRDHADQLMTKFDVRPNNANYIAGDLSGGNQQKLIIAREITNDPDVLIAAQPTRGLDVGAIEYIHQFLVEQRDKGKAVLLVSFELDEIMNLSDRIGVIYEGKINFLSKREDTNERELGHYMAGGGTNEAE